MVAARCRKCAGPIRLLAAGEWWCDGCMRATTRRGNPGRWLKPGVAGRLRYVISHRRKPVSPAARLRMYRADLLHVLTEIGERCQDCGRDYVLWHAPDDLYREVCGSPGGLLCPGCFARRAEARGLIVEFIAREFGREA